MKCKYRYNQKVTIKSGFYRGYKGYIDAVHEDKKGNVVYNVNIEKLNKIIEIEEHLLKPSLF